METSTLDIIVARLDSMETGFNRRMDGLELRMDRLDRRMDGLEQRMYGFDKRMNDFDIKLGVNNLLLESVDRRLCVIEGEIERIAEWVPFRTPPIKL
ncbi:hypothetical protein F0L74_28690 [Chitinophaga agrisoli]|uniref:t-SNARE coiled-coil homology domain-containing protein n=1 Tax=Chitinophaga agrisoli TaxID=2607653 RepID=A0A5B2VN74_9BACT|nr:hypothetical protein [Chitinophaga agrisoli]KAA2240148.1 hypothetical protein F0L74_28690 [Chitinophaga agrisoli]